MALPYTAASHIVKVYDWIINQLWPVECVHCGKEDAWLCEQCEALALPIGIPTCPFCDRLSPLGKTCTTCKRNHALTGARSLWYYRPPVNTLVHGLKYRNLTGSLAALVPRLAQLTRQLPLPQSSQIILTCVPTAPNRKIERGYNQSELLARALAQELKLPFRHLLLRKSNTLSQTKLTRIERFANIAGQITPRNNATCSNCFVILVDDVITTGATLSACAEVLKNQGARSVWGVTIAKD